MPANLTEGAGSGLPASFFEGLKFFGGFRELSEKQDYYSRDLPDSLSLRNPVCGDEVRLLVRLENAKIAEYSFQARGCWPIFSCLQWLGDTFLDKDVSTALSFTLEEFFEAIEGVPAGKRHALSLTHRAFRRAVTQAMMVPS
ncbi:MAG: iron-sulfur cluster assembly scaffold protein [Candidatus Eremiobacteraeota bacterium]|nr:iron-sulfur cluster assembly scaffold protein [Candidatus Eremiobacteraeota bacterium]